MNQFITAADVRTFANIAGTTGRYSDAALGSNIRAAQGFLQRESGRLFEKRDATAMTFTTDGRAQFAIPDVRTVTSITKDGATLTADATYWLLPDAKHSGVYVAIQLRRFQSGGYGYLSDPLWWDKNLDHPPPGYAGEYGSAPNDLVITGDWGWDPLPEDVLHAVKVMATWLTKRADAALANAVANPEGAILDYSQVPPEMVACIRDYRRGSQAVAI